MRTLTSVIFKNSKRRERIKKEGTFSKILSFLSFVIVFGTLSGVMIWASIYVTTRLKEINQMYAFVNIMLFVNFGILFLKSVFETLNVLYFSKDLNILLRMPIKSKDILHSKLLKMITSEYEMEIIMLGIPMIVYGIIANVGYAFYLYIIVILAVIPIIPISITGIIIACIMRITNSLKNKNKVMYIAIALGALLTDIVIRLFGSNGISTEVFRNAILVENGLAREIANNFKLIVPIMNVLMNYDNVEGLKNLIFYVLLSFGAYILTIIIISPIYLKGVIGTIIGGNRKGIKEEKEIGIEDFTKKSFKKAYLLKEYRIIRRSPIFFIQCLLLPILFSIFMLIIAISLSTFTKIFGFNMISEITEKANKSWGTGVFLSMAQVFFMINFTSIIAISKEERWALLCKYIPIKLSKQINMKLFMGKVSNFVSSLSVVFCYYVCTENIINSIVVLIISFGLNVFGEKVKLLIDLKNPKIDWDNEYTMMKQNTNVMYELFYTMIIIRNICRNGYYY